MARIGREGAPLNSRPSAYPLNSRNVRARSAIVRGCDPYTSLAILTDGAAQQARFGGLLCRRRPTPPFPLACTARGLRSDPRSGTVRPPRAETV